jgi:hypothetical protein
MGRDGTQFDVLEQLEPRLLLSADLIALDPPDFSDAPVAAEHVVLETSDELSVNELGASDSPTSDLFDDLNEDWAGEPETAAEDAGATATAAAPVIAYDSSADISLPETAIADTITEQLVTTLHAANPPPAGTELIVAFTGGDAALQFQPTTMIWRTTDGDIVSEQFVGDYDVSVDGDTTTYTEVFSNVDFEFILSDEQLKQNIILNALPAIPAGVSTSDLTLDFAGVLNVAAGLGVYVDGVEQHEDFSTLAAIEFRDEAGHAEFVIPVAFSYDSSEPRQT